MYKLWINYAECATVLTNSLPITDPKHPTKLVKILYSRTHTPTTPVTGFLWLVRQSVDIFNSTNINAPHLRDFMFQLSWITEEWAETREGATISSRNCFFFHFNENFYCLQLFACRARERENYKMQLTSVFAFIIEKVDYITITMFVTCWYGMICALSATKDQKSFANYTIIKYIFANRAIQWNERLLANNKSVTTSNNANNRPYSFRLLRTSATSDDSSFNFQMIFRSLEFQKSENDRH